ncbi:MAG: glycoside hydrolase family 65 protein, partial [Ilumatobacter sp.]
MTQPDLAVLNDHLRIDDAWTFVETGYDTDRSVAIGSNFMVGNGYLGYRATTPDQGADDFVALVVSDTYDCADGRWRELTVAPNPLFVEVRVNEVVLRAADASDHEWSLHLRDGRFRHRCAHVVDGSTITITTERFAGLHSLELLGQRVLVEADTAVEVEVAAGIDAKVWDLNGVHLPHVELAADDDGLLTAQGVTGESGISVVVAAKLVDVAGPATVDGLRCVRTGLRSLAPDRPVTITTMAAVASSNDVDDPVEFAASVASAAGYDAALRATGDEWQGFWDRNDVSVAGAPLDDAALRFSAYHHRICLPAHTDHLPVGARGLSCQAYQGSAFWDQEIYNLPAVLYTEPEIARSLLVYRHRTLDGARRKAARLGYDGAYYAWVSGETGDELCPDVFFVDVLTGREIRNHFNVWQMHVAPDVVTTVERYVALTGDTAFLVDHGAEIAFEVARFLRSFALYNDVRGTYHCVRLLGPDEWHENVDDNAFTNHQAHAALSFAIDTHARLQQLDAAAFDTLCQRIGLVDHEVERWVH